MRIVHIFWNEYWGSITRRSYLLITFGFPIVMVGAPIVGGVLLALAVRAALPPIDPRPIGLVDQAGLFSNRQTAPHDPVSAIFYPDPEKAAAALAAGDIQAYYDIQPDYWQSGKIIAIYPLAPSQQVEAMLTGWVRSQVRAKVPPDILTRLDRGPNITHQNLSGSRAFSASHAIAPVIVYMLVYFVRLGSSMTASYMFDSIGREADDRTLEILITTISPQQFITGKLLGLLAVGLTQLGTWGSAILALGFGIAYLLGFNLLGFLLNFEHAGLLLTILVATYILDQIVAAAMALLRVGGGAGNMFFDMVNLVVGIGLLYATYFVPRNPQALLAVVATFVPFTAPVVLPIRLVVSDVPTWQIIVSQISLWGTSLLGLFWLGRLLQTNLVAYGPPFSLRRWLARRLAIRHALDNLKSRLAKS